MRFVKLAYLNGVIKEFFEEEVDKRIRKTYKERREKEILRNMLTDTDTAIKYIKHVNEIQTEVKAEIEDILGFAVDVGFEPKADLKAMPERVESLEATTGELNEVLTMLLEGVTE